MISLKGINSEGLSVLHANIRSVPANVSIFVSYMSNINLCVSVIGLSETWLSPFSFDTYGINGQTYITGAVYCPPNSKIVDLNNTMHSILEKVAQYPCYIMGDFNLDLRKHDKHPPLTNFLILCMLTLLYRWSIVPQGWRRILVFSLIISILITIAWNMITAVDYLLQIFQIIFQYSTYPRKVVNIRLTINAKQFASSMQSKHLSSWKKIKNTNWSALDPFEPCQTYFSNFLRLFKSINDESFPIMRIRIKYRNPPSS